jgi:hypothetical protein
VSPPNEWYREPHQRLSRLAELLADPVLPPEWLANWEDAVLFTYGTTVEELLKEEP